MKSCKNRTCGRDISHLPRPRRGPAPTYCDPTENPECKREREANRKALERARAYNGLVLVIGELPGPGPNGPCPQRATSEPPEHFETSVTSRWDEIVRAWYPPRQGVGWRPLPASRGPEIKAQWSDVDRLMGEAERGVRRLDKSAGAPVGQLRESNGWSREDAGCPGELWLRGQHEAAIQGAERDLEREKSA